MKIPLNTLVCFIFPACLFAQKIDWKNIPTEYKKPVIILEPEDQTDNFLSDIGHVRWNAHDNHYYVSDVGTQQIYVYDTRLNYIRSYGRLGQGPGEFNFFGGVDFTQENELVVTDHNNLRVQILAQDGGLIQLFTIPYFGGFSRCMLTGPQDHIYLNYPNYGALFTVYKRTGEEVLRLGELIHYENPTLHRTGNIVEFDVDESGIYCVFRETPLIRKYSHSGELLLEIEFSDMPEVKNRKKNIEKSRNEKYGNNPLQYQLLLNYTTGISLDSQSLYVNFIYGKKNDCRSCVYVISKVDFSIKKRLVLEIPGSSLNVD
ncbi:6-bladed beta-propeller [bacterium]|nr:6-bladed beta-propeller [bacterium]